MLEERDTDSIKLGTKPLPFSIFMEFSETCLFQEDNKKQDIEAGLF